MLFILSTIWRSTGCIYAWAFARPDRELRKTENLQNTFDSLAHRLGDTRTGQTVPLAI